MNVIKTNITMNKKPAIASPTDCRLLLKGTVVYLSSLQRWNAEDCLGWVGREN